MAVRPILRMGDPLLFRRASEIAKFDTPWLRELLTDMHDTMHAANGAGIAAPQIGVSVRAVIFGFERNERYPDAPAVPPTVLINPVLTPLGKELEEGWEGCLSSARHARPGAATPAVALPGPGRARGAH